jgi:hypothetical protein
MGKSIGILMGLCCKQKLEYSSDRYVKSLSKPKEELVAFTSAFPSLHSLTKLTKLLASSHYLRTEGFGRTKNGK